MAWQKTAVMASFLTVSMGLYGCSSNSSSGDPGEVGGGTEGSLLTRTSDLQGEQTGEFVDARVMGLPYWTASNGFGTTDENGGFNFLPGEMVVFYIGNQVLLYTDAELLTTPMDVLSAEVATAGGGGHPHEAINILRFLQSVDRTPGDDERITIPSYLADTTTDLGLNFAQDSRAFAVHAVQAFQDKSMGPLNLVSYAEAADHFRNSLLSLENNLIDLTGTWFEEHGTGGSFGDLSDLTGEGILEIELDRVAFSGTEVNGRDGFTFTAPFPVVEADVDAYSDAVKTIQQQTNDDWPLEAILAFLEGELVDEDSFFTVEERDGRNYLLWSFADFGLSDRNCDSAHCSLAEFRSTTNNWDEACLHDAYDYNNPPEPGGTMPDGSRVEYFCEDSDQHNGPVVGYSEVTWADRLGGDRLVRMKRDFTGNRFALTGPADELTEFQEQGYFYSIMDRKEAREAVVDLTGQWNLVYIGSDPRNETRVAIEFGDSVSHPWLVPFTCEKGYSACGWPELNQRQNGASLIHVRGTDVVNWATADGFYTMQRAN